MVLIAHVLGFSHEENFQSFVISCIAKGHFYQKKMLLRASLTNYDKNSTWNAEPINPPCGPTGEHIAQFAKSIVFSSIKGQYDKKIFKDLDSSFIWDRQPTRTASVQSTCFSPVSLY